MSRKPATKKISETKIIFLRSGNARKILGLEMRECIPRDGSLANAKQEFTLPMLVIRNYVLEP